MAAEDDFDSRGQIYTEALGADGTPNVGPGLEGGTQSPNIRTPQAVGNWAQYRAVFFSGQLPSVLRGPQFTVRFVSVAVESESVGVRLGDCEFRNLLADEIEWQPTLAELVFPLDFAFGLGG